MLAILEKANVIKADPHLNTGTVSAGYQNFIICIEMFFASVALRYAFPYQIYGDFTVSGPGRSVTMQSISSSLKVKSHGILDWNIFISFIYNEFIFYLFFIYFFLEWSGFVYPCSIHSSKSGLMEKMENLI